MNTLLYKNLSHTLFLKGLMLLWCVRDGWRDIYSGRGWLLPISSSRSQGVPTLAPPCKSRHLWSAVCPWLDCDSLHSKSDCMVSFRLHTCCTRVPWSRCCLLIKMWLLAIAHGVTWNKLKIHVICYITLSLLRNYNDQCECGLLAMIIESQIELEVLLFSRLS